MPQGANRIRLVIFDWAGTTVDFGSLAPVRTLQQIFARANIALTELETRQSMGLPKKDHIRQILMINRVREEWKRIHGHVPGEAEVDELYQHFVPLQFSCLLEYSAVIPGVVQATERFRRRGLKIASTTGYTREMLDLLVEAGRKAGYVPDCNLCPSDVGGGRPQPFMIYEAAVRLQVYPLQAIVKIGAEAALRVGISNGTRRGVAHQLDGDWIGRRRSVFHRHLAHHDQRTALV